MRESAPSRTDQARHRLGVPLLLALVWAAGVWGLPRAALRDLNNLIYDNFFRIRPVEDQRGGPVVIVAADNASVVRLAKEGLHDLPWPRDKWAEVIPYAQRCGARAVVFDLLFDQKSEYADQLDDDVTLAQTAEAAKIPVIFGVECVRLGDAAPFAPYDPEHKAWKPIQGNTIVTQDVLRWYEPIDQGMASLATATLNAIGRGQDVFGEKRVDLHFFGARAFEFISAADVFDAFKQLDATRPSERALPALLRDKIVVVGVTATAGFDSKSAPIAKVFPGVAYQATAIVDMLEHRKVHEVPQAIALMVLLTAALGGAAAGAGPRRAVLKSGFSAAAIVAVPVVSWLLFSGATIYWLAPAGPMLAAVAAVGFGLLWSYLVEDRNRKFFARALTQYVSPAVVEELSRHPEKLRIGSEKREMSMMFTDIAGFTDLSEKLQAEELAKLLNYYLNEMSSMVLNLNGTVDKYVGDAIVSFWNAPLVQPDHAERACRAALAMHRREMAIADELSRLGGPGLHTRLGINTGMVSVGNMGCDQKFNYSVLGDPVNLASRLEGQNKAYGTSILISQTTADAVKGKFLLRKIDAIRVKGKLLPVTVYELISESPGSAEHIALAAEYALALEAYQAQKWDEAERQILAIQARMPEDGPCKTLAKRIATFRHDPPPPQWDGVFVAKEK